MLLVMKSLNTTFMRINLNLVVKLCRRFLSEADSYLHMQKRCVSIGYYSRTDVFGSLNNHAKEIQFLITSSRFTFNASYYGEANQKGKPCVHRRMSDSPLKIQL